MKILLTPAEKQELESRHKKERNVNKKDCIKAVLLHSEGWDIALIAEALLVKSDKVLKYLKDYEAILLKEHAIQDLNKFNDKNTFILLHDRLLDIERLIKMIDAIPPFMAKQTNTANILLNEYQINLLTVGTDLLDLVYVWYRSMFQNAEWEDDIENHILPKAYSYTEQEIIIHEEIVSYVNWTSGHQDNPKAYEAKMRGIYHPGPIEVKGNKHSIVTKSKKHLTISFKPLVRKMKQAIETIYYDKYKETLPSSIQSTCKHIEICESVLIATSY